MTMKKEKTPTTDGADIKQAVARAREDSDRRWGTEDGVRGDWIRTCATHHWTGSAV